MFSVSVAQSNFVVCHLIFGGLLLVSSSVEVIASLSRVAGAVLDLEYVSWFSFSTDMIPLVVSFLERLWFSRVLPAFLSVLSVVPSLLSPSS